VRARISCWNPPIRATPFTDAAKPQRSRQSRRPPHQTLIPLDLLLTPRLPDSISSTNAIESGLSTVEKIWAQFKLWPGGDHRLRGGIRHPVSRKQVE